MGMCSSRTRKLQTNAKRLIKCTLFSKIPGNYLQALVLVESYIEMPGSPGTDLTQRDNRKDNIHAGKGVTLNQLHEIWDLAKQYLPSSPLKDLDVVKAIDHAFPPLPKDVDYSSGCHKYVAKSRNEQKVEAWLRALKEVFIDRIAEMKRKDPNDPVLNEPMHLSLLEVGWGKDVRLRANAHDDHTVSNDLWTFFQALVQYLYGEWQGEAGFEVKRLATHYLTRGEDIDEAFHDAKVGDVGMTMLGRTEWFHGGLNPAPGGGAGVSEKGLAKQLSFIEKQAKKTYTEEQSRFKRNIVGDRQRMLSLKAVADVTDKDISDQEAQFYADFERCCKEWDAIEAEMKLLEGVRLTSIARQLAEAGLAGQAQTKQNNAGSSLNFAFGMEDQGQGAGGEDEAEFDEEGEEDDDNATEATMMLLS